MNKRADEKYLSIWMFINWVVIGSCLVVGALIFLLVLAEARQAEAEILADRLSFCMADDFSLEEFNSEDFDIYDKCALNKVVLENSDFYYFNITIREDSSEKLVADLAKGRGAYRVMCEYQANNLKREENFAKCSTEKVVILDKITGIKYEARIIAASNQN